MFTQNCIDIDGASQQTLSVTTVAAETLVLAEGVYDLWSTSDVYISVGLTVNGVTVANGYKILAGNVVSVRIRTGRKIGAIAEAVATLSYHKVD